MRVLAIIALCIGLFIVGWKLTFPAYTYRYRLSIAVEVDGQTKTASSVIEVRAVTQPNFGARVFNHPRGDAVFLDLGEKGNVISLLGCGHPNPYGYLQDCIPTLVHEVFGIAGMENLWRVESLRGSWELTGKWMPTLITFLSIRDPEFARVVRPEEFETVFGADVHFKRAWIEMTSDPVTDGIEKHFPWWKLTEFGAFPDPRQTDVYKSTHPAAFIWGEANV